METYREGRHQSCLISMSPHEDGGREALATISKRWNVKFAALAMPAARVCTSREMSASGVSVALGARGISGTSLKMPLGIGVLAGGEASIRFSARNSRPRPPELNWVRRRQPRCKAQVRRRNQTHWGSCSDSHRLAPLARGIHNPIAVALEDAAEITPAALCCLNEAIVRATSPHRRCWRNVHGSVFHRRRSALLTRIVSAFCILCDMITGRQSKSSSARTARRSSGVCVTPSRGSAKSRRSSTRRHRHESPVGIGRGTTSLPAIPSFVY